MPIYCCVNAFPTKTTEPRTVRYPAADSAQRVASLCRLRGGGASGFLNFSLPSETRFPFLAFQEFDESSVKLHARLQVKSGLLQRKSFCNNKLCVKRELHTSEKQKETYRQRCFR